MSSNKMWAGRTSGATSHMADDFNSSIRVDGVMYRQDIEGSKAHAAMLAACGIIEEGEAESIRVALDGILADLDAGTLSIDPSAEDVHMFVEQVLTERIGEAGKRLHTARSRNDQVALDVRLYLKAQAAGIRRRLLALIGALADVAEAHTDAVMPGYTHLQRAQPITFAQHLLAYVEMLKRDVLRIDDATARMNLSPLGACALAGTTYPIDRRMTAEALGLDGVCANSLDAVSDRDFCVDNMKYFMYSKEAE